jgi:hypothetical protein
VTEFVSTPPGAQATTYTGTKGNQDARKRLVPGAGGLGADGNTYSSTPHKNFDKRRAVAYGTIVIPPNKSNSSTVSAYIENHGGKILLMPPISRYFNPIETIWSWLKGKWRNELI